MQFYGYVGDSNVQVDPFGLMAKKGPSVSMNVALTDVEARGVHVNVLDGKESMHVEIYGKPKVDVDGKIIPNEFDLAYKPADPTATSIMDKNSSRWSKITESVDDFAKKPKNASKLANVADAAKQNYPNNTRDFETTSKALKQYK